MQARAANVGSPIDQQLQLEPGAKGFVGVIRKRSRQNGKPDPFAAGRRQPESYDASACHS
jgi:hypothetical protein